MNFHHWYNLLDFYIDPGIVNDLSNNRDYTLKSDSTTLVYFFCDFINDSFQWVIIALVVLFLLLYIFISQNLFRLLYNDKIKEIFILQTIGVKRSNVILSLVSLCGVTELSSALIGSIFSFLALLAINAVLNMKNILNLNFGFLGYNWWTLLLLIGILGIGLLISTLAIYLKINKKDYSE